MVYKEPNKHTIPLISNLPCKLRSWALEGSLEEASSCLLQGRVYSQDLDEASALRKTGQLCLRGLPKRSAERRPPES